MILFGVYWTKIDDINLFYFYRMLETLKIPDIIYSLNRNVSYKLKVACIKHPEKSVQCFTLASGSLKLFE